MIEFLSNSDWINSQINFLTLLQTIRTEHFEYLNNLFLSITILGELWLPIMICSIIYWCIDTKSGIYLCSLFGLQLILSQFLKMLACVYRPWVLCDKIHPVELAINAAKGYSFPSGHSSTACSVLGGLAFLYRKNKLACFLLILTVLCVGFSRMWLGVHTPQDVAAGLTLGLILVFLMNSLINWADKKKNRYLYLLLFFNIFAISALTYICYFNNYPLDYVNGTLLVNPKNSIYSAVICHGLSIGFINGAFLCRRFIPFDAKQGSLTSKIKRGVIGAVCIFILLKYILGYIYSNMADFKLALLISICIGLFITLIYPWIMIKYKNKN